MRAILNTAPFEGDAWTACKQAFLRFVELSPTGDSPRPASYFLSLYSAREPTYPPEGQGRWGEDDCRRRLGELGTTLVSRLIAVDDTRSWAIFMDAALERVLAFHGRALPQQRPST